MKHNETLKSILDCLIPASAPHNAPSGADDGIVDTYMEMIAAYKEILEAVLVGINEGANTFFGQTFIALSSEQKQEIMNGFKENEPEAFGLIASTLLKAYYQDPRVIGALGMQARAPFPLGFEVEQGDWSLLEPVRQKSKLYRDA
jgi:hypothetical protein